MGKINNIRLEIADNGGFMVSYEVQSKATSGGTYTPMNYEYKKEVYEDSQEAIGRMMELAGNKMKKNKAMEQAHNNEGNDKMMEY